MRFGVSSCVYFGFLLFSLCVDAVTDVLFVCNISEVTTDAKRFSEKNSADHNLEEGSILCLTFLCMYMDREAVRDAVLLKQEGMHILLGFCCSEGRPEFLECL